jgi:hypothetical protein
MIATVIPPAAYVVRRKMESAKEGFGAISRGPDGGSGKVLALTT